MATGKGSLSSRIRELAQEQGIKVQKGHGGVTERTTIPEGLSFPGDITLPSLGGPNSQEEERDRQVIEEAKKWEEDPYTLWTDGSGLQSGVSAAAVVGCVRPESDEFGHERVSITTRRQLVSRPKGILERKGKTYGTTTRSIARSEGAGGYRLESWSLSAQSTAFDAELQALVRAVEICALDAREGVTFRVFTDSQAAMRRLASDQPGPGQSLAVRGIRVAKAGIYDRGAKV